MSIELLTAQVRELQKDLVKNSVLLKQCRGEITQMIQLLGARTEIYKSIAHRQGMIIECLKAKDKYNVGQLKIAA